MVAQPQPETPLWLSFVLLTGTVAALGLLIAGAWYVHPALGLIVAGLELLSVVLFVAWFRGET